MTHPFLMNKSNRVSLAPMETVGAFVGGEDWGMAAGNKTIRTEGKIFLVGLTLGQNVMARR